MIEKIRVVSLVMNNFKQDFRVLKEAKTLAIHNYSVKIIALHDGKSSLPLEEKKNGILVERILLYSKNFPKNKIVQGLKYLEYMFRVIYRVRRVDVIHCNDVEPLFIAMFIKLISFGRVKVIYDAHELEYDKNGIFSIEKKIVEFQEFVFLKFVDAFITVSESIANLYRKKYGVRNVSLILNCPPLQLKKNSTKFRDKFKISSSVTIFLYQGRLTRGRGLEKIIEAFRKINREDIALVFIGEGELKGYMEHMAASEKNIFFHEAVPPEVLYQYTSSADIGLCCIEGICKSYYYCLPNKLFEYIHAGLPVICSNLPELKRVVNEKKLGIITERDDIQGIMRAIEKMLTYKEQQFVYFKSNLDETVQNYCWEKQEINLLKIYEKVTAGK